jgi:hypothetical protein
MNYVGLRAAASHLGRSESWLRRNLIVLEIPHYKVGGRFEFELSEIDQWRTRNHISGKSAKNEFDWPRLVG